MKIVDNLARWIKMKATTTVNPERWFVDYFQGGDTASGIKINNTTAFQISTVFACMRAISEDIAKLPLNVYKSLSPRGKEIQYDHPVQELIHTQPNNEMPAMAWREAITCHALGWGNGYSLIDRDKLGRPIALWPLAPNKVIPKRRENTNQLYYELSHDDGSKDEIDPYYILAINGLGFDGIMGYNVIHTARESMGMTKAAERFGATFYGNGANIGGVFEHPGKLSDKAYTRLKKSLNEEQGGLDNAHKVLITEEGIKFNHMSFNPDESQFLETRQFSVAETCRWFRMPPNKVGDTTRAQGWTTLEQTNTSYVVDTLMPWITRWEAAINVRLFTPQERAAGYFVKHNVNALLRGDIKSRTLLYEVATTGQWMLPDEIRELEEMNPLPDGQGMKFLEPVVKAPKPPIDNTQEAQATLEPPRMPQAGRTEPEGYIDPNVAILDAHEEGRIEGREDVEKECDTKIESTEIIHALKTENIETKAVAEVEAANVKTEFAEKRTDDAIERLVNSDEKVISLQQRNGSQQYMLAVANETTKRAIQKNKEMRQAVIDDIASRISSAEISEIKKRISKAEDPKGFNGWLNGFYKKEHEKYCGQCLELLFFKPVTRAKEMIKENRFRLGDGDYNEQFEKFCQEITNKHREFLNAKT